MNLIVDSDLDFLCCLSNFNSSVFEEFLKIWLYVMLYVLLFFL